VQGFSQGSSVVAGQIPAKVFEYMQAGHPVLTLARPDRQFPTW
jgi:hypothetical protein